MLSTADQDWKILCKPVKGLQIRLIVVEDYKLLIFHYDENIVCNLCKGKNFQCVGYSLNLKWAKQEAATQKGSLCLQGRCKREMDFTR